MKFTKYSLCVVGMMIGIAALVLIPILSIKYSPF